MRRTLVASFVIVALASAGWFASIGVGSASHSWLTYHWARMTPSFDLKIIDSTTSDWDVHRATAQADWSDSTVLNLVNGAADDSSGARKRCAGVNGQVRVCNAAYGNNGWLGLASIWISGNHIVRGTAKNNDTYFNTASYNTPAWRQFVMCQEIGHTFGLAHQDETFENPDLLDSADVASCMDYTNDPSQNQQPNAHDYEQLVTIYGGHTDSTNSFSTSTASSGPGRGNGAGAAIDDDPSDAVPAGASAKDGRVFVRDLGNGQRVISVVIWASDFPGAGAPGRNDH